MSTLSRRAACARLLAGVALAAVFPAAAQDPRNTTVQRVARDWLAAVDRADYDTSWKEAGAKYKLTMTPQRWAEAAKAVRGPLGAVTQRSVIKTTFTKTFPGAPEGDYALVIFRTAFQKKPDSDETVTLEREADGSWRVVGYGVR